MKVLKAVPITIAFIFLFVLSAAQVVDVDTFEKGSSKEVQLLDVRTPEEFNAGHIANAMHANWNEKAEFIRRIEALDKDQPVYIYCLSGRRSAAAADLMREKGFSHVTELKGGINAWKQEAKPLEGAMPKPEISIESYQTMLKSSSLVLVDFGATWCPPCRKMEPVLKEIEKENPTVTLIRIDGGRQTTLMKENKITEMPTYILYKDGAEVWKASGAMEKDEISTAILKHN